MFSGWFSTLKVHSHRRDRLARMERAGRAADRSAIARESEGARVEESIQTSRVFITFCFAPSFAGAVSWANGKHDHYSTIDDVQVQDVPDFTQTHFVADQGEQGLSPRSVHISTVPDRPDMP